MSVSEDFANLWHKNSYKVVFQGWKHYFGVPNFRKKFCHEHIQSNLLDQKWCFRVFRSILQSFDSKIQAKFVFWRWMYYLEMSNFWKKFYHKCIQSNLLDPKRCFGVFESISQTFDKKTIAKLVFRGWMHYFEVRTFGRSMVMNTSNLTY